MSNPFEQRIKDRLKSDRRNTGISVQRALLTLFLERILSRIAHSTHKDKLIFKGGLCLAQFIPLQRETKDIDFLLTSVHSEEYVRNMFLEILSIDLEDGFLFSLPKIRELSITHKQHPGYRIECKGSCGQIKQNLSLDIGIGDKVFPIQHDVSLYNKRKPLFEASISLQCYPPEFIFSEKLEAILFLGDANGRMKDFFDCYKLIESDILNKESAKQALFLTLEHRDTAFSLIPTPKAILQQRWLRFVKREGISIDLSLNLVIQQINAFLQELKQA